MSRPPLVGRPSMACRVTARQPGFAYRPGQRLVPGRSGVTDAQTPVVIAAEAQRQPVRVAQDGVGEDVLESPLGRHATARHDRGVAEAGGDLLQVMDHQDDGRRPRLPGQRAKGRQQLGARRPGRGRRTARRAAAGRGPAAAPAPAARAAARPRRGCPSSAPPDHPRRSARAAPWRPPARRRRGRGSRTGRAHPRRRWPRRPAPAGRRARGRATRRSCSRCAGAACGCRSGRGSRQAARPGRAWGTGSRPRRAGASSCRPRWDRPRPTAHRPPPSSRRHRGAPRRCVLTPTPSKRITPRS